MNMLGYTINCEERIDERHRYVVKSWFGNDEDVMVSQQLIAELLQNNT